MRSKLKLLHASSRLLAALADRAVGGLCGGANPRRIRAASQEPTGKKVCGHVGTANGGVEGP